MKGMRLRPRDTASRFTLGLGALLLTLAGLGMACDGSNDDATESAIPTATGSPTATEASHAPSAEPTPSDSPTPTLSPSIQMYQHPRFGYTIELPEGWHLASAFMDAFAASGAELEAGRAGEDYLVLTDLSTQSESESIDPNYWLGFFRLTTVVIFPTARSLDDQLTSISGVGHSYTVSNVQEMQLDGGLTATRYTVEIDSDEDYYIYDRAFVSRPVNGCPTCTGFVIQTVVAGRPKSEPPRTVDPPPASYPVEEFELILRSFRFAGASANPSQLFLFGIRPGLFGETLDQDTTFPTASGGFALEVPVGWQETASTDLPGYFHVGWIDPVAQGMPPLQFDIDRGASFEIQAIRREPVFNSEADLVNSIIGDANDPAFGAEVIDSGTVSVDGEEAYRATYLTSVEGHIDRVTKVIWQDGAISFMLR